MKKICVFILASMLLLGSCSPNSVVEETAEKSGTATETSKNIVSEDTETEANAADDFLSDLHLEVKPGVASSTLKHAGDITSFKSQKDVMYNTAPMIYTEGEYTYIMRRFPEELRSLDEINTYLEGERINEIEIYENHQYSEPAEVITLEEMAGKNFHPYAVSYDSEKDVFYAVMNEKTEDDYIPIFYEYSHEGAVLNRYAFTLNILDPMICLDGKVYAINNAGYSGRAANLYVTDPASDEKTKLDEGVIDFYTEDGLLYYVKNAQTADYKNVQRICSYDPETGTTATVKEMQTDEMIVSVYYDSANDTVYFGNTVDLFAYNDGETVPVITTLNSDLKICEADGEYLYMTVGVNQISLYKIPDEPASLDELTNVLKVCIPLNEAGFEHTFRTVCDIMSAVGLPIEFEFTYVTGNYSDVAANEDEYVNTMAKKFLAGDTDFDIFYLTSTMSELFDSKYYEDLAAYPTIKDYYDKMIPGMKELTGIDGKVSLVPVTLNVPSMRYTDYALSEPHDAPKTFEEFFSQHGEITEDMPEDYFYTGGSVEMMFMDTWFDELASNYLAKMISDETAESDLTKLFETITSLNEYDNIYIGDDYNKKNRVFRETSNPGMEAHKYANDEELWIALPAIGEDYKTSVSGSFIAVNPKSSNKELALKFVTYYLNSIYTGADDTGIHYFEQDKVDAENSGVDYEGSQYTSFKEQIANSIHKTTADNYYSYVRKLYLQIEDGAVTPEEAASQTLRYLKMMRDE